MKVAVIGDIHGTTKFLECYKNIQETDSDVEKIIVLLFLEELLSYNYFGFITEEDYEIIVKSLYCVSKDTCLIDFPSYATYDSLIRDYDSGLILRDTEASNLRISEKCCFREKI